MNRSGFLFRKLHRPAGGGKEQGSVLIIALMVLVLVTSIGLPLALVTETEMLIGGNEQIMTETFYAAETGVSVVLAQATIGNTDERCLAAVAKEEDDTDRMVGTRKLGYSIDTTSVYPVAFGIAPYSKANAGRGDVLYSGFFHGSVRAIRGSWPAASDAPREAEQDLAAIDFTVQGEKEIDVSFFVSPIQSPIDLAAFDHPAVRGCDPHPVHSGIGAE